MKQKEDIDKIQRSIEDFVVVYPEVKEAKESGDKLTWAEGGRLFIKHGGKLIRFAIAIPEIAKEVADIDGDEGKKISDQLVEAFGGTDKAKKALEKIAEGAGKMNQGIQELVALKKV